MDLQPSRVGAVDRDGQPYDRSDPAGYGTSVTKPEGYDAFWQETWDQLQDIPLGAGGAARATAL